MLVAIGAKDDESIGFVAGSILDEESNQISQILSFVIETTKGYKSVPSIVCLGCLDVDSVLDQELEQVIKVVFGAIALEEDERISVLGILAVDRNAGVDEQTDAVDQVVVVVIATQQSECVVIELGILEFEINILTFEHGFKARVQCRTAIIATEQQDGIKNLIAFDLFQVYVNVLVSD